MAKKAPQIVDLKSIQEAGIDPKTGLPVKLADSCECILKENIKKILRIQDEQDAVNRYIWKGLPSELSGNMIERILFYRGQGMFFYIPEDKFYFLPYTLEGTIDVYGRYQGVTPLAFGGGTTENNNNKDPKPWIPGLIRIPVYNKETTDTDPVINCVLLSDYTKQLSQNILSRQSLNDGIIDFESDMLPFLRTALLNSTGIDGMRVSGETENWSVEAASRQVNSAALNGRKWIGITGDFNLQTLTGGMQGRAEEFLLAMQAIENFRLSTYGLDNGGLFIKKAHTLNREQDRNDSNMSLRLEDGLNQRLEACELLKKVFGEKFNSVTVKVNPNAISIAKNDTNNLENIKDISKTEETKTELKEEN